MRVIFSPRHRLHATETVTIHGEAYAETPPRAERLLAAAQAAGLGPVTEPADHGLGPILAVHPADYVAFLRDGYPAGLPFRHAGPLVMADTFHTRHARRRPRHPWSQQGYYSFDIQAPLLAGTWEAAYWSAQCALTAADAVRAGAASAYALCRPPGHHALADQAGGFCYLNNAALAARHLQAGAAAARVAILDVDYHHGNGTQEIFYTDPSVLYVSLHGDPDEEYPFWWGGADEQGAGAGQGYNLNLPLPKGTDDARYLAALDRALAAIAAFQPAWLVLSLGLDIGAGDPSALGGGFAVTAAGFGQIGQRIAGLGRPTVIVQEGGYRLETLGENAAAVLRAFTG
ncbi:MAG: histone deacetylase family protein [Anaerolineales bacterium]|nr:histone deacetylase family protein [Anaerolineales bacterium]